MDSTEDDVARQGSATSEPDSPATTVSGGAQTASPRDDLADTREWTPGDSDWLDRIAPTAPPSSISFLAQRGD